MAILFELGSPQHNHCIRIHNDKWLGNYLA